MQRRRMYIETAVDAMDAISRFGGGFFLEKEQHGGGYLEF